MQVIQNKRVLRKWQWAPYFTLCAIARAFRGVRGSTNFAKIFKICSRSLRFLSPVTIILAIAADVYTIVFLPAANLDKRHASRVVHGDMEFLVLLNEVFSRRHLHIW